MRTINIPAVFHPTTVVLIDDNPDYLLTIQSILNKQTSIYKVFDNPKQALDYLCNEYQIDPFIRRSVLHNDENEYGHQSLDVELYTIREEVYNPKRFEQISVVVIDQEMPGLKGLELCQQIKGHQIKKLMLTGEVNDKQAIQAFNAGIIDHFINKSEDDFQNKLNNAIYALQMEYFRDISTVVIDSLIYSAHQATCLNDPGFIEFFNQFCKTNHICEYYLCDESGSFTLLDAKGRVYVLAVQRATDMQANYLTAHTADHPPAEDVLEALKNHSLLLYAYHEDDTWLDPSKWYAQQLLHPAQKLTTEVQTYYHAKIEGEKINALEKENVLSLQAYVDSLLR